MIRKVEYLFPLSVIVKALVDIPDLTFVKFFDIPKSNFDPVILLSDSLNRNLKTRSDCLNYIGYLMRNVLKLSDSDELDKEEIGKYFLQRYILIHLENNWDKVNLFKFMVQKLFKLKNGEL